MGNESKSFVIAREVRFYVCMAIATAIIFTGIYIPPEGELHESLSFISTIICLIGALAVGINIEGVIREIRLLRKEDRDWLDRKIEADKQETETK